MGRYCASSLSACLVLQTCLSLTALSAAVQTDRDGKLNTQEEQAAPSARLGAGEMEGRPGMQPRPPQSKYGPWNRDLEIHESSDGLRFTRRGTFVERGGVPALARTKDGRLLAVFQWFPLELREDFDKIAVMLSEDDGQNWSSPQTISITGMPDNLNRSFDPTLVVLDDGTFRLYFSSERGNQYGRRGNRAIFSAISKDGLHYTFEPGQRFGFESKGTFDCAVAPLGGAWHMYCPIPGNRGHGYHAVSRDGLNFTQLPNVIVPGRGEWLGAVICVQDGLRFYGSGGRQGGWVAFSQDGASWELLEDARTPGGDPGVVLTTDGRVLAISTGPLREDASKQRPSEKKGRKQ